MCGFSYFQIGIIYSFDEDAYVCCKLAQFLYLQEILMSQKSFFFNFFECECMMSQIKRWLIRKETFSANSSNSQRVFSVHSKILALTNIVPAKLVMMKLLINEKYCCYILTEFLCHSAQSSHLLKK